jgi:hypothetical protein
MKACDKSYGYHHYAILVSKECTWLTGFLLLLLLLCIFSKHVVVAFDDASKASRIQPQFHSFPPTFNGKKTQVTLSSPCLWASFHPLSSSLSEVRKVRRFYSICIWNLMHKVWGNNYSSCTGRRSEIIWSSSGGAQEKGKRVIDHNRMKTSSSWLFF